MDQNRPNRPGFPPKIQRSLDFSHRKREEWRSDDKENRENGLNATPERLLTEGSTPIRKIHCEIPLKTRLLELDLDSDDETTETDLENREKYSETGKSPVCPRPTSLTITEFKEQSRAIQRELRSSLSIPIRSQTPPKAPPFPVSSVPFSVSPACCPSRPTVNLSSSQCYSDLESISRSRREAVLQSKLAQYEQEITRQNTVISALKSQVCIRSLSIEKLEKDLSQCTPEKESREILLKVRETLGVTSSQGVVPALRTLERKGRGNREAALWLREVGTVVCPDSMETDGENVLSRVKQWESELNEYRKRNGEHANLLQFFKKTLKCAETADLKPAVSSLFSENHELRSFFRQIRAIFGQRDDCPPSVLLRIIKQRISPGIHV